MLTELCIDMGEHSGFFNEKLSLCETDEVALYVNFTLNLHLDQLKKIFIISIIILLHFHAQ